MLNGLINFFFSLRHNIEGTLMKNTW